MRGDVTGLNTVRIGKVMRDECPRGLRMFIHVVQFGFNLFFKRIWKGRENIPEEGGVLIAANHISNIDPVFLGEFIAFAGRLPRFMARHDLFGDNWVGRTLDRWGMIPVDRHSARPGESLIAADEALQTGHAVVIYPEATFTFDPDGWPMRGHSGAARLALETRMPVIPVGQWGAHTVMPGRKASFPRLFPRKTVQFLAGPPVNFDDLYDLEDQRRAVRIGTERIMNTLTALVAEIRGEEAPAYRFDRRVGYRVPRPTEDEL